MSRRVPTDYALVVGGWVEHLRAGGTTAWSRWSQAPAALAPDPLPDALHLEVLRRLNLASAAAGRPGPLGALTDRVLATGAPGRGPVDVPLTWAPVLHGTPPRDPAALDVDQLLRLTTGVLAHLLPGVPPSTPAPPAPDPLPLPWRRRFQLHGSPLTAAAVRRGLRQQGLAETSWRATHVVLALPLEAMMAEQWARRVRDGGPVALPAIWRRSVERDALPGDLQVTRTARRLVGQGRDVHVVVAPDAAHAAATTARLLGARPPGATPRTATRTDVVRRVNRLTPLVAGPDRLRELARRLDTLLGDLEQTVPPPPAPAVPPRSRAWARQVATSYAEELRGAGYPVHGDPGLLVPSGDRRGPSLDPAATLELALAACLRADDLQRGTP